MLRGQIIGDFGTVDVQKSAHIVSWRGEILADARGNLFVLFGGSLA
jgi:hypothetical protein